MWKLDTTTSTTTYILSDPLVTPNIVLWKERRIECWILHLSAIGDEVFLGNVSELKAKALATEIIAKRLRDLLSSFCNSANIKLAFN